MTIAVLHAASSILTVLANDSTLGLEAASRMPQTPTWIVLSFPVFAVLRALGARLSFAPMMLALIANSVLWGGVASLAVVQRRKQGGVQ